MNTKTMILMGALSSAVLLSSACVAELDGEEGNLVLSYDKGAVTAATGSSPMAKGAKLKYSVTEKDGNKQKLPIDAAESSADKIIAVANLEGGAMTLEALDEGRASIDVDAKDSTGNMLQDVFALNAVEVDSLSFANPCEPDGEAAYFVDTDIRLHYTMRSGSKIAVGYGYYPVNFIQTPGVELGETRTNGLLPLHTALAPGSLEIGSTISEDTFSINMVELKDVNALKVYEEDIFNDGKIPVALDKVASLHVFPQVGAGTPVCQNNVEMTVDVSTPETCEVMFTEGPDDTNELFRLYETQILEVHGLAKGACEFSVTMLEANDGAGVTIEQTVQVGGTAEADDTDA